MHRYPLNIIFKYRCANETLKLSKTQRVCELMLTIKILCESVSIPKKSIYFIFKQFIWRKLSQWQPKSEPKITWFCCSLQCFLCISLLFYWICWLCFVLTTQTTAVVVIAIAFSNYLKAFHWLFFRLLCAVHFAWNVWKFICWEN